MERYIKPVSIFIASHIHWQATIPRLQFQNNCFFLSLYNIISNMIEKIVEFLITLFNGNAKLITLIASMVPLIELKGAIPVGVRLGENLLSSALFSYLGSTIVFFFIFFLLIPIFTLLKKIKFFKKLVEKIEAMFERRAKKIAEKKSCDSEKEKRRMYMKALFIFVAVPFPVTGVWTGTAIAVFLKMKFKDSILPISIGNLVAGSIITLLTFLFKDYVDIIIYTLFAIVLIMLIVFIVKVIRSNPDKKEEENEQS